MDGLSKLQKEAKNHGLTIEIEAAAEYYFDETLMPKITNKELLTFGDNYVLVEFAFHSKPQFLDQLFFELSRKSTVLLLLISSDTCTFSEVLIRRENGVKTA